MATTSLTVKPKTTQKPQTSMRELLKGVTAPNSIDRLLESSVAKNETAAAPSTQPTTAPRPTPTTTSGSYTVQPGDTLSQIAARQGVSVNDISGYRSGDPNKIFAGEKLTFGSKTPATTESTPEPSVTDALRETFDTPSEDRPDPSDRISEAENKRTQSFDTLRNLTTKTFDEEYKKRDLDKSKERMSTLDGDIARLKAERDEAINKVRTNPGLSASQMTGDIKKLADFQNSQINNLIEERNSVASEYNSELESIDRTVQNRVKDAELEFQYWDKLFSEYNTQSQLEAKLLREELLSDQEQENFETQLAQQLQIAGMPSRSSGGGGSTNLRLETDPVTGEPLYWFNPSTGEITRLEDEPADTGDRPASFEDLSPEEETTSDAKWWQFWK